MSSYHCSVTFGLYKCDNWSYGLGTPTWTHVGQTMGISEFALDTSNPDEFQGARSGNSLYVRRPTHYGDDNWHEVFNKAAAEALVPYTLVDFCWVEINDSLAGHIYTTAATRRGHPNKDYYYLFKSTDYGTTWGVSTIYNNTLIRDSGGIWSLGTTMYAAFNRGLSGRGIISYSTNEGVSWNVKDDLAVSIWMPRVLIDPTGAAISYTGLGTSASNPEQDLGKATTTSGGYTECGSDENAGIDIDVQQGAGWISTDDNKYIRTARASKLYYSNDEGGTWNFRAIAGGGGPFKPDYKKAIWGHNTIPDWIGVASSKDGGIYGYHVLTSTPDLGVTWYSKAGANADTADTGGGDSLPYNCGGVSENGLYLELRGDVYTSVVQIGALLAAAGVYTDGAQIGTLPAAAGVYSYGVRHG